MNKYIPLPSVQGEMSVQKCYTFPLIKFGDYENCIQKFVAGSEEDLIREILHAKKYGKKNTYIGKGGLFLEYRTAGVTMENGGSENDDDYVIFIPSGTKDTDIPEILFYNIYEYTQCECTYAKQCSYHKEGSKEDLPPPRKEYCAYLAFIPKKVITNQ